jgi:hypothetical protein
MSNEQAKKDYLEAVAKYEEHVNMAGYALLLTKYSERQIKKNADALLEKHWDEFMSLISSSEGLIYRWIRDDITAMREAESRL